MNAHAHSWEDPCTAFCPAHEDYTDDFLRSCGCCDGSDE